MARWRRNSGGCSGFSLIDIRVIDCDFFRLYDEDDSGVIDLEEMTKISTYLYHIDGMSEVKTDLARYQR